MYRASIVGGGWAVEEHNMVGVYLVRGRLSGGSEEEEEKARCCAWRGRGG